MHAIPAHCRVGEGLLHEVLLTTLMEQQTVTNSAVIHGLCAMTKQISRALLAQARPHDDNSSD